MSLAPIVLFVYNRPQHTLRTLEALSQNVLAKDSDLYVFADGAKENADEETLKRIKEVREIVKSKEWCKKTILTEGKINKGLGNSIIEGVSSVVNGHGKVIVLEDDLVTSPYFLKYMNDALDTYQSDEAVACISGYVYPVKSKISGTFFLKGADCWGWATWGRAWNIFEKDGTKLLDELNKRSLNKEFDFDNTYPYVELLEGQIAGINNSWAVRWYASAFLKNMYCLYPGTSLVQNIGFDGSGIHSSNSTKWNVQLAVEEVDVKKIVVEQSAIGYDLFKSYFKTLQPSVSYKLKTFLKKLIN